MNGVITALYNSNITYVFGLKYKTGITQWNMAKIVVGHSYKIKKVMDVTLFSFCPQSRSDCFIACVHSLLQLHISRYKSL